MATSAVLEEEIAAIRDVAHHFLDTGFHVHGRYPKSTLASLPSMTKLVRQIAKAQKRPIIVVDTRYDGVHTMTIPKTPAMRPVYSALMLIATPVKPAGWGSTHDVSVVEGKSVLTFWFRRKDILADFIKSCQEDKALSHGASHGACVAFSDWSAASGACSNRGGRRAVAAVSGMD
jgi:hypothetical protein